MSAFMSRRTALRAAGAARAADDTADASLVTYPVPTGAPVNDGFIVKVRTPRRRRQTLGAPC